MSDVQYTLRWDHVDDGYPLPAQGHYTMRGWALTILDDHTRLVPDSSPSDCRIVLVGDSIAMGWGVDDDETWINQLAHLVPGIEFVNATTPGATLEQIERRQSEVVGDGYIFLLRRRHVSDKSQSRIPLPSVYELSLTAHLKWRLAAAFNTPAVLNIPSYEAHIQSITAARPTLLVSYDVQYPGATFIEWISEPISLYDGHPTAASNNEFARLLVKPVQNFINEACHGI
jgi:hypothetical protein